MSKAVFVGSPKEFLIDKERAFKKVEEKMFQIRSDYIRSRNGDNCIFISDHAIVRFLERVMGRKLNHGSTDTETLQNYSKKYKTSIRDVRDLILKQKEMRHIVLNGLDRYEKKVGFKGQGIMVVVIKNLTVTTIYMKGDG